MSYGESPSPLSLCLSPYVEWLLTECRILPVTMVLVMGALEVVKWAQA